MTDIGNYLTKHLLDILRHASGGKHPPSAWVFRDASGHLTHTFDKEICADKEVWGGARIPISCLDKDGKGIFVPKRPVLLEYLSSFGLTENEAEMVLSSTS